MCLFPLICILHRLLGGFLYSRGRVLLVGQLSPLV